MQKRRLPAEAPGLSDQLVSSSFRVLTVPIYTSISMGAAEND